METMKYNEMIWDTIQVLKFRKCQKLHKVIIKKLKNVDFIVHYNNFEGLKFLE